MRKNRFATAWIENTTKVFELLSTPHTYTWVQLSVLLLLPCAVCSCSSISGQTTQISAHTTPYASGPPQPPTQPAAVRILRFGTTQPNQQLGEIVLIIPTGTPEPKQQVEDKLRDEAAKLGADAVVVVDDRIQSEGAAIDYNWYMTYPALNGEKVVAKAIKFEPLTPTGRTQ
jgi:hypothetical protein